MIFGHLVLAELFKPAILLEQPLDLLLQLLVVKDPFILLSPLALHISIEFSLFIPPLLLLLPILLLHSLP